MDEDLRRQLEDYRRVLQQSAQEQKVLGAVSEATADNLKQMRAAIAQDTRALNAFGKEVDRASRSAANMKAVQQAAGATVQTFKGLAGSLGQSNMSFSQFSGTLKSVTGFMGKLAGSIPLFGQYLEKGTQAAGEAASFVLNQVDTVVKVYSELGSVGALTVRGVDGLRQSFDELGLVGLPEFADAIKRNSVGIAALGSTTSRGAVRVGKALGQLTDANGPFAGPLLNLGFTLQEISAYGTDYVGMLALSGNRNIQTTEQITDAMVGYLRQIDEVSRATGKSREQINDENKKQQADVRFRAKLMELEATGRGEEAKAYRQYAQYAAGPLADAIRASVSGVPLTKDAAAAVALFGGAVQQQLFAIQNGATGQQAFTATMAAASENATKFNKTMQYGAEALGSEGLQGQFLDMAEIYRRAKELGIDPVTLARQERERLEAAGGATRDLTQGQVAIAEAGRSLQKLALDFLPAATTAVAAFGNTVTAATNALRKVLGLSPIAGPGKSAAAGTFGGAAAPEGSRAGGGAAAPATGGDIKSKIKQLESGGRNVGTGLGGGSSSAFGLYQMTRTTFNSLAANAQPGSALYGKTFQQMRNDPMLQEAAMDALLTANMNQLRSANVSTKDAAVYMAHVLGARTATNILQAADGVSIDDIVTPMAKANNPGLFKNVRTVGDLKASFDRVTGGGGYQFGGIARGPKSGYMSVLHGTEAVVPLPDGRTIPVSMPNDLTSGIREQVSLLSAQLSKMDEMIGAMRAQTAMSQKILQHSTS